MHLAFREFKIIIDVKHIGKLIDMSFATSCEENGSTRFDALLMWENKVELVVSKQYMVTQKHNHI